MLKDELAFPEEQVQSAGCVRSISGKAEARHTGAGVGTQRGPECWGKGIRPPLSRAAGGGGHFCSTASTWNTAPSYIPSHTNSKMPGHPFHCGGHLPPLLSSLRALRFSGILGFPQSWPSQTSSAWSPILPHQAEQDSRSRLLTPMHPTGPSFLPRPPPGHRSPSLQWDGDPTGWLECSVASGAQGSWRWSGSLEPPWLLFEHLPPSLISSHGCRQWEQGEEDEGVVVAVMAPGKGREKLGHCPVPGEPALLVAGAAVGAEWYMRGPWAVSCS